MLARQVRATYEYERSKVEVRANTTQTSISATLENGQVKTFVFSVRPGFFLEVLEVSRSAENFLKRLSQYEGIH
jgi:pectin methylesterase-like acyl-CoA thioesterase